MLGAGPLGRGKAAPPGVNEAPVICGRRLVDAEGVGVATKQAGQRRRSAWPTTTATTCWNPSGKRPGDVTVKVPLASVVTTAS